VRLVHISDLHLGFRQYYRLTQSSINQREADVAKAFRTAIDRIIELEPEVILFAGDIFHTVRPMNPAIIYAFNQLSRLQQALPDAIVVMIAGNHDRPRATETGCILQLFSILGVHVVDSAPRRLSFPERDLSILAVPDSSGDYPALMPEPGVRHNVLVIHSLVPGVLPPSAMRADRPTMEIPLAAIGPQRWSYVALGHYHVHRQMAPNTYYSGSTDYTSTNTWSELFEERELGLPGKGFIEFDLERGVHTFHPIDSPRTFVDLPAIPARGMSAAELDVAIRDRVDRCKGGIEDKVVRLVVRDIPRHIARELDQRALREYKRRALFFHLDTRRPDAMRASASGAPGRRPTLRETVESYLTRRSLTPGVDRDALVRLGTHYLEQADAAASVAAAGAPVPLG
jgi:DNA repair protein SbcD/Mre11